MDPWSDLWLCRTSPCSFRITVDEDTTTGQCPLSEWSDDAQVDHNNIYFHSMLNSCGWCYLILMRVISHMSLKKTRFGNASNLSLTEGESSSWTWSIKIQSTAGWRFSHFMSTRSRRGKASPRVKIIRDKVMKPKLWFGKPFLGKLFDMLDEMGIPYNQTWEVSVNAFHFWWWY